MDNVIQFENRKLNLNVNPKFNLDVTEKPKLNLSVEWNEDYIKSELAEEYNKVAIKSKKDLQTILNYLLKKNQYRNYLLFVIGVNVGLRSSDLIRLRFIDFIDENLNFRDEVVLLEHKTRNTRKNKKTGEIKKANRHLFIGQQIKDAFKLYLDHIENANIYDYIFKNNSNNRGYVPKNKEGVENKQEHISTSGLYKTIKKIDKNSGVNLGLTSHSLRKSFGFWFYVNGGCDNNSLVLLQLAFGHSSLSTTLHYIGITNDDLKRGYLNVNLGLEDNEKKIELQVV